MTYLAIQNKNSTGAWVDTFDITISCVGACGRHVEQTNITASDLSEALSTARARLVPEGWETDGGGSDKCRACLLDAAGWQSQPGPNAMARFSSERTGA